MSSHESKTTTDHDVIRKWAEERGGEPVSVRGTGSGDDPGMLRIDFPGGAGEEDFKRISWDDWFEKFDSKGLKFLYQEQKESGESSTFFKLIDGDAEE